MIGRIAALLGIPTAWLAWIAVALVAAGSAAVTGALVHSYERAQHDKVIADLRRDAAQTLATETGKVLAKERAASAKLAQVEDAYARLQQQSAEAGAESVRLSGRLDDALERLRQLARAGGGGGGSTVPAAGAGADRCADLRAALDRTTAAVERLKSGGDAAAAIGQRAVDVATVAADDARSREVRQ